MVLGVADPVPRNRVLVQDLALRQQPEPGAPRAEDDQVVLAQVVADRAPVAAGLQDVVGPAGGRAAQLGHRHLVHRRRDLQLARIVNEVVDRVGPPGVQVDLVRALAVDREGPDQVGVGAAGLAPRSSAPRAQWRPSGRLGLGAQGCRCA